MSRRLIELTPGVGGGIGGQVLIGLTITGTLIGQAFWISRALDAAIAGGGWPAVRSPIAIVLSLLAIRVALVWTKEPLQARTRTLMEGAIRSRLTARLLELGPSYSSQGRTGAAQAVMVQGVEGASTLLSSFLPMVIVSAATALLLVVAIGVVDPVVGLIVAVCAVVVPLAPIVSERAFGETARRFWNGFAELGSEFLDALQGMATLKALNAQEVWSGRLNERSEDLSKDAVALASMANMYIGFVGLGVAVGTTISVAAGAMRVARGAMTGAELLAILLLVRECFRPLSDLQAAIHPAAVARAGANGVLALLDAVPQSDRDSSAVPVSSLVPSISLEHVWFAYQDGRRPALDDVTFSIGEGETVSIVGRSGAGKTTVTSLLLRFFDPQRGRIRVGGHDVRDLSLEDLRRLFAVVPQDTYLFHRTIRENLLVGRPSATEAEMVEAARSAFAHEFISRLPDGYDTVAGERGTRLSGGERQRIAIARAILKDAPILVLDEATSSVDAASESLIRRALGELRIGRTTLVIAHRLSTIEDADRIVVLDDGRVVESGPPADLLAREGAYARLVLAQGAP